MSIDTQSAHHADHINNLPSEILAKIFISHLTGRPRAGFRPYWHEPPEPSTQGTSLEHDRLIIESVCHQWANITHSTPQLWCTMHTEPLTELDLQSMFQQLDIWISRSGILPLSLQMHYGCVYGLFSGGYDTVMNFILRYANRWLHLQFEMLRDFILRVNNSPPNMVFPQLRTLLLEYGQSIDVQLPPARFPRLETLALSVQDVPHNPDAVCWKQLTTIELDHFNIAKILDVITYARSLVHLRVHLVNRPGPECVGLPTIKLPTLETLDLRALDYGLHIYNSLFKETVRMPRLKRFRCVSNAASPFLPNLDLSPRNADGTTPLEMFLLRSQCPIKCSVVILAHEKIGLEEMDYYDGVRKAIPGLVTADGGRQNTLFPSLWSCDYDPSVCENCFSGFYRRGEGPGFACTICDTVQ